MEKIDIIIFPFHDYKKWIKEGLRTRDAHLFEHFRKDERIGKILVVNRPVSLAEAMAKRKSWKTNIGTVIKKQDNWEIEKIDEKTFCIDFFTMDFIKVAIQRKKWWNTVFKRESIIKAINQATETIGMENKILFLQNPMSIGVVGKLGEKEFVFDAIDNWLYHPQMKKNKKIVKENYEFIIKNADKIYTVSESLQEFFSENKNVKWIPNGVDKERFKESILPDEEKRQKPCIGYMGKIQDRVDFELIRKCLEKYPENEFLIIGPIYSQKKIIKELKKNYSNIKFLGDIHYNNLPKEMKKIDIAILPHKVDLFTKSMNPLKIYEYLAGGKQVVTTKVAGTEEFKDYVYIAENDEEFVKDIQIAIEKYKNTENISTEITKQIKKENLWEGKVDEIIQNLEGANI